MNIYVGNLPFSATEDEVRELFGQFGEVETVKLVTDRETGRPRGFGFVEMNNSAADAAIKELNNAQMGERTLKVNQAQPKKTGGGGGGGRRW
jgi:RNA recognition motif-containing protein